MADSTNDPINERLSLEKELIELLNRRQGIENDTLDDARDLANVIRSQTQELSFQNYEKNKLRSLSRDIAKVAEQSYSRDKSVEGTSKDINSLVKAQLDLESKITTLDSFRNKVLSEDLNLQEAINTSIKDQIEAAQKLSIKIRTLEEDSRKIANNFGVKTFGALEDITKSIPGLRGLSEPFNEAAIAARTAAQNGKNGASALMAGGKSLASSLSKAIGPAAIFIGLIGAFTSLDTMIGNTAKNMGISYKSAAQLNSSFTQMANESGNIFVTTKGVNESFNQINAALGTNGVLSADILVSQTELVKQAGYSVEAATMLSKLSLATGKPTKDIAANFLGSAKALNLVNGTAINEKQLLEDISGLSKDTLATFSAQPGKLAEAAYEARKLGLSLEKLKGTQSSLLSIESSIAAEFEAEVLTGKQLNLEKARYFALTNDYAGLAKELGKQDITRASFADMNVIQQEATAKALGMSADTMGGMLIDQEAMAKLSGVDGDNAKERFNNLVKEVGLAEAKKRLGNDTLADQMASASTQDKFNASIEKLKEIFITMVDPLMSILGTLSSVFSVIGLILKPIAGLNKLIDGMMGSWSTLGKVILAAAVAAALFWTASTGGLGGLAILATGAAVVGGIMTAYDKVSQPAGDINSPADGKTQISTKEGGLFELSKNDDVVAFPGASKAFNRPNLISPKQNPNQIKAPQLTFTQQQSQPLTIDYDKMAQALSKVQVNTNIDGVQVSNQLFNKSAAGMAIRKI